MENNLFITERLIIKKLSKSDIEIIKYLYNWHFNNEFLQNIHSKTYNSITDYLNEYICKNTIWIALLKDNNSVVGYCRIINNSFSYICNPKYRNCGYMTEMLSVIIKIFNMDEIIITIRSDNIASQRVAEKIGFIKIPSLEKMPLYYKYIYYNKK